MAAQKSILAKDDELLEHATVNTCPTGSTPKFVKINQIRARQERILDACESMKIF